MKISVAMCTCYGDAFLKLQLDSIFSQTRAVDEIVVVDDRSTDETTAILEDYQKKHPAVLKVIVNEKQLGVVRNFEKAISLCSGDWIFLSDQDDIWEVDKVEEMTGFAAAHTNALMIYTDAALIDEKGNLKNLKLWERIRFNRKRQKKYENNWYAFRKLLNGDNYITGATVLISATLKESAVPFLTLPSGYLHDLYLGIMAASKNGLYSLNKPLTAYRIHPHQQVGTGQGVAAGMIKKEIVSGSFQGFYKELSKTLSFRQKCILYVIKKKKQVLKKYSILPESHPVKKFYRKIFK